MPPASSRSGVAQGSSNSGGTSKSQVVKKAAQPNNQRRAIPKDLALLKGSSDLEGKGQPDHEDDDGQHVNTASTARDKGKGRSIQSTRPNHGTLPSTLRSDESSTTTESPRRSTRLTGEELALLQATERIESAASQTQRAGSSKHVSASHSHNTSTPMVPKKRKALTEGSRKTNAGHTQPTPPDTDSDSPPKTSGTASHSAKATHARKPPASVKKQKAVSGDPISPKAATRAAIRQPSDYSSDDDGFAFTQVGDAPAATAPVKSSHHRVAGTSHAAPPASAPEASRVAAGDQRHRPIAKAKPASGKGSDPSFAQLRHGLENIKRDGERNTASADKDRKGKRKADHEDGAVEDGLAAEGSGRSQKGTTDGSNKSKTLRPKKGRVAELSQESSDEATRQLNTIPPEPGTPGRNSRHVPINTQETPAIQRNVAMRQGLPTGTPGSITRRTSGDLRGRRGSSIGNGFEALPHPSVPTDTLYKHINPADPPAIRLRTLVTWSMHRLKDKLEKEAAGRSAEIRSAAAAVMDKVISDLAEKRLDLSWTPAEAKELSPDRVLPPNPENIANAAKVADCQAWIKRLRLEDEARNARINEYRIMTERISKLATPLPPPTSTDPSASDPYAGLPDLEPPNFSLPMPKMKTKAEFLAYGKSLLETKAPMRRKSAVPATETNPDVINVQEEYPIDWDELRHQAASMDQASYRIEQFLKLADTFVSQHLQRTQATLLRLTGADRIGAATGSAEQGSARAAGAGGAGSEGDGAAQTTSTLVAIAAGSSGPSESAPRYRGPDPIMLLRAISRADTAKKR